MAARRLIALGLAAVALAAVGCGEDEPTDAEKANEVVDEEQADRRAKVERAVEAGKLPPVALELFRPDGSVNISFVDGPNGDEDVVRTGSGGESGPKLRWDLDGDGEISADEREITERELYDATLGMP
jgi:hypothetical protein